jgi:RNA polymerase sigma-70 factor (ECF subfamily)
MMALAMPGPDGVPDVTRAREREAAPHRDAELDRATLARCKAHDPMAFRAFVVRYERPVFALVSRVLGHGAHVEDLAQETFLRAYRAFPTFDLDAPARPSTWLLTIATRLALDARRRKALPVQSMEAAERVPGGATPETERARGELGRAIATAAAKLGVEQRAALVLYEIHGLSMAEIASAMDVPEATAKTRLFRARERMREELGALWRDR